MAGCLNLPEEPQLATLFWHWQTAGLPCLGAETTSLDVCITMTVEPLDHCTAPAEELSSVRPIMNGPSLGDSVQAGAVRPDAALTLAIANCSDFARPNKYLANVRTGKNGPDGLSSIPAGWCVLTLDQESTPPMTPHYSQNCINSISQYCTWRSGWAAVPNGQLELAPSARPPVPEGRASQARTLTEDCGLDMI